VCGGGGIRSRALIGNDEHMVNNDDYIIKSNAEILDPSSTVPILK
jgi:hypothetical protein